MTEIPELPVSPELLKLRRGLGWIVASAGVIHMGEMVLASLYSLGRLRMIIPAGLWTEMYFAHFLYFVMAPMIYLFLGFKKSGIFYYEVLVDYLVVLLSFILVLFFVATLLVKGKIDTWFSMAPGFFLLVYGSGLIRGLPVGFGIKLPKK